MDILQPYTNMDVLYTYGSMDILYTQCVLKDRTDLDNLHKHVYTFEALHK